MHILLFHYRHRWRVVPVVQAANSYWLVLLYVLKILLYLLERMTTQNRFSTPIFALVRRTLQGSLEKLQGNQDKIVSTDHAIVPEFMKVPRSAQHPKISETRRDRTYTRAVKAGLWTTLGWSLTWMSSLSLRDVVRQDFQNAHKLRNGALQRRKQHAAEAQWKHKRNTIPWCNLCNVYIWSSETVYM